MAARHDVQALGSGNKSMSNVGSPEPAVSKRAAFLQIPVRTTALTIAVAMALYVIAVSAADWEEFKRTVGAVPGAVWAQFAVLSLLSYMIRFVRWHGFLSDLGHSINWKRHLEIYLSAFALTLTPGKAGETIRSVFLQPFGVGYSQSLAVFVSERLLDLVAVGLLASGAILAFPAHRIPVLVLLGACASVVVLLRSRLLGYILRRLDRGRLGGHVDVAASTLRHLLRGGILAKAFFLSCLAWLAQGFSLFLIVHSMGYAPSPYVVVSIYCLSLLVGAASFIPGGLGATEASIALLLMAIGIDKEHAIIASLVARGLTLWLAVGVGVIAMVTISMRGRD